MNPNRSISRRHAFRAGLGLGASVSMLPGWLTEELLAEPAPKPPTSPNDKPGIGLVGCGGRGRFVAKEASRFGHIVAVCDVDRGRRDGAAVEFGDVEQTGDFRKLIERKDVDVIVNATPDHWHTFVNIHAVKNGKDVYAEKPLTLTIDEGKHLRKAVKDSGRVLQVGSQQRSEANFRLACELVRNGRLGKLTKITTFIPAGLNKGPFHAASVPGGLDWEMWLGQTRKVAYVPERCLATFRYWYDYSGGTITDWGAHHNDIARWALGVDGPVAVEGRPTVEMVPGGYTAASQYRVTFTYADGLKHVCRTTLADGPFGEKLAEPGVGEMRNGVFFEGENGWIYVRHNVFDSSDPDLMQQPLPSDATRLYVSNDHMGNFFECVRTRKQPVCDVETGHRSATMCHLGAIAMRLQRPLKWDPVAEQIVADDEASSYISREQRKPWTYETI